MMLETKRKYPLFQDNLGTNTYSSALLVGEKGADLVAEDLGTFFHSSLPWFVTHFDTM